MMIATNSIRWRLMIWLAFLLACILSGFGVTAYQLHRTKYYQQLDQQIERRVAAIGGALRQPPRIMERFEFRTPDGQVPEIGPREPREGIGFGQGSRRGSGEMRPPMRRSITLPEAVLSQFDSSSNGFYFILYSGSKEIMMKSTNAPDSVPRPEVENPGSRVYTRLRGDFRERFYFSGFRDCILVGRRIAADERAIREFGWWLTLAGLAVLGAGVGGVWWLATRALRPVEDISAAATRISGGNLSERINVAETESELGRLAGVLNSAFARLEAAFAQQKQFTADASHELRTPLAVMISEAQTTLARERSAAEYRETIEICLQSAQQMRGLTSSLLELARWDAGQEQIQRSTCDLAVIANECAERLRPLAKAQGISIECDGAPASVNGDVERLGRVVSNLLTNAIFYNRKDGKVRVHTFADNGSAILTVTDTGVGIAAEDVSHIFERFYRADKSRARAEGHSGLGLAICQTIVEAHGGSIEVSSKQYVGTTFTVKLPSQ